MIGNDLVDLQEASLQSNWKRKGYLEKVFTAAEREQIRESQDPNQLVWLFWSMKEAAYKIDSKITGLRDFSPTSLACINVNIMDSYATGKVTVNRKTYFTETDLNEAYIHTIAAGSISRLPLIQKEIYLNPSKRFNYKSRNPACLSHHGRYLALIF